MVLRMRLLWAATLSRLAARLFWTRWQRSQSWTAGETQERAASRHEPAARDRSEATGRVGRCRQISEQWGHCLMI